MARATRRTTKHAIVHEPTKKHAIVYEPFPKFTELDDSRAKRRVSANKHGNVIPVSHAGLEFKYKTRGVSSWELYKKHENELTRFKVPLVQLLEERKYDVNQLSCPSTLAESKSIFAPFTHENTDVIFVHCHGSPREIGVGGFFLTPELLADHFDKLGLSKDKTPLIVVWSCKSGISTAEELTELSKIFKELDDSHALKPQLADHIEYLKEMRERGEGKKSYEESFAAQLELALKQKGFSRDRLVMGIGPKIYPLARPGKMEYKMSDVSEPHTPERAARLFGSRSRRSFPAVGTPFTVVERVATARQKASTAAPAETDKAGELPPIRSPETKAAVTTPQRRTGQVKHAAGRAAGLVAKHKSEREKARVMQEKSAARIKADIKREDDARHLAEADKTKREEARLFKAIKTHEPSTGGLHTGTGRQKGVRKSHRQRGEE